MAIRRQKLDRKAALALDDGRVVDIPPGWAFTIDSSHHGKIQFDFNSYREHGRDNLASHIRDAFWSLRRETEGVTLKGYEKQGIRPFWRFLDELLRNGEAITRLEQIDRRLLDRYLAWIELQVIPKGKLAGQRWTIATRKQAYGTFKSLLVNRQKRFPAAINSALTFPRNPFPNCDQLTSKREPYSASEQKRILDALHMDLRSIYDNEDRTLTEMQVLAVHLLVIGLATGRNLQPLLELRRDSIQCHPLHDRELLVTYKRRGWATHASSYRKGDPQQTRTLKSIPSSVGEHVRFLCEFTEPLVADAGPEDKDLVFLVRMRKHARNGQVVRLDAKNAGNAVAAFAVRHVLIDDKGQPLILNIARTRPTFGTELYRRCRDIRRVQQALGHAKGSTTARHYVDTPLEAERDHAIVLDGMVSQFARMEIEGKVLVAADGKIPLQDVEGLLSGGYNTGIARCKNPFRENESVCQKFFHCFKCPSMCVFEDDLWRLFSFYYRLLAERTKINPAHWLKTYGPIIRRIDADIASQFPEDKVAAARLKALQTPHPTWKGPLL